MADKPTSIQLGEPPEELTLDYFRSNPKTYSSQLIENLKSNAVYRFLFGDRAKEPSNRDMLIISSVVIASSDEKIADLREERLRLQAEVIRLQKETSKIKAVLSYRILSGKNLDEAIAESTPAVDPAGEPIIPTDPVKGEAAWVVRYLTIGNLATTFVVIIGLMGATLTYFTQNFKDEAARAENQVKFVQASSDRYEAAAKKALIAQQAAEDNAKKLHESDAKTLADSNARLSQSQSLSSNLSEQLRVANKKLDDAQKAAITAAKTQ